jgi:hypothetical protein
MELPHAQLDLRFQAPASLGFGVALKVKAPDLESLWDHVRLRIGGNVTRQNSRRGPPRVTVQNKVTSDSAKKLFGEFTEDFVERSGSATGLLLWEHFGSRWRLQRRCPFEADADTAASPPN